MSNDINPLGMQRITGFTGDFTARQIPKVNKEADTTGQQVSESFTSTSGDMGVSKRSMLDAASGKGSVEQEEKTVKEEPKEKAETEKPVAKQPAPETFKPEPLAIEGFNIAGMGSVGMSQGEFGVFSLGNHEVDTNKTSQGSSIMGGWMIQNSFNAEPVSEVSFPPPKGVGDYPLSFGLVGPSNITRETKPESLYLGGNY
jgi:hypothetical protein